MAVPRCITSRISSRICALVGLDRPLAVPSDAVREQEVGDALPPFRTVAIAWAKMMVER